MNCSEFHSLLELRFLDSIALDDKARLDKHLRKCRSCDALGTILWWAEQWKKAKQRRSSISPVEYDDLLASLDEIVPPSRTLFGLDPSELPEEGSAEWRVARETESLFLSSRRDSLRAVVTLMDRLVAQTHNEVLERYREWLSNHIRAADELAAQSGLPSQRVYPDRP